jgi:hypothetical protein
VSRPGVTHGLASSCVPRLGGVKRTRCSGAMACAHARNVAVQRIGNMNALRRRAPLAWVPSPCLGPAP